MSYVYIQTETARYWPPIGDQTEGSYSGDLWTVGHYDPSEKFIPESDHVTTEAAAQRVHYLNGGRE